MAAYENASKGTDHVKVADVAAGQWERNVTADAGIVGVSWHRDTNSLLAVDHAGQLLRFNSNWRLEPLGRVPSSFLCSYSPDGQVLLTHAYRGSPEIRFWNATTGAPLESLVIMHNGHDLEDSTLWQDQEQNHDALEEAVGTNNNYLAISPEGHYAGPAGIEREIVYVVETNDGYETLTPGEFGKRFNWRNDPSRVHLLESGPSLDSRTAIEHTDEAGKVAEVSLAIDKITDLVPLRAFTSLRRLRLLGARDVLDLSPLVSLPLEELTAPDNLIYANARILEGMTTLKHLNGRPIAEFYADLRDLRAAEWALGMGGRLGSLVVRLQEKEIIVKDRSELPPPPFRVILIAANRDTNITSADLECLRGLRDLRVFDTMQSQIDDAGLEILRTLPNIQELNVRGSRISDEGLRAVGEMPSLTKLIISETGVSDAGIEHILACRNLWSVWVTNTKLTGAGVRKLLQLPKLAEIVCGHVALSRDDLAAFISVGERLERLEVTVSGDDDVAELVKLPKLQAHTIVYSAVSERSFELVASNPRLIAVGFPECRGVTDQCVAPLRRMPQLQFLNLGGTEITDVALTHLVALKQLNVLGLASTKVGHGSVPSLKQMTALKQLDLNRTQMTAEDIAELRAALPGCQITWDIP